MPAYTERNSTKQTDLGALDVPGEDFGPRERHKSALHVTGPGPWVGRPVTPQPLNSMQSPKCAASNAHFVEEKLVALAHTNQPFIQKSKDHLSFAAWQSAGCKNDSSL